MIVGDKKDGDGGDGDKKDGDKENGDGDGFHSDGMIWSEIWKNSQWYCGRQEAQAQHEKNSPGQVIDP